MATSRPLRLALALLALLALAGCVELAGQAGRPAGPTPGALPAGYPPLPEGLPQARVLRVVDGDTVDIDLGGREERVRLIGINTPESVDPRRPVECYGREASESAKALLGGRAALFEADPSQGARDRNGRLLGYLWLEDGRLVNLEQISGGYAFEYTYDTPYRYQGEFRAAEAAAREAGAGLWAADTCAGQSIPAGEPPPAGAVDEGVCRRAASPAEAPEAPLRIVGLDKGDELAEIENVSAMAVSLEGWALCSMRGGEQQPGLGGELAPGERRAFANPGDPIWSNSQPDDAALYDGAGRLVSYWQDR